MKPYRHAWIAAASASVLGLMLATMGSSSAQTWTWTYAAQTPNNPLVIAQSSVSVSANSVRMAYTVPVRHRDIVIEKCTADLRDIEAASTLRTEGTDYLLIRFKPSRTADCASGKRLAVALPADDERYIEAVALAINRSCCSAARVAQAASPAPRPTPSALGSPSPAPAASPSPSPSPSPLRVQDWVETQGLFAFVRVRNLGAGRVTVSGAISDCRDAESGCGPFPSSVEIDPGRAATVASVTSTNGGETPVFRYRYTASNGEQTISANGTSTKAAPPNVARLSGQELRAAQAAAIGDIRGPSADTAAPAIPSSAIPSPEVPARLLKRGTSRLAIGQTGTALVRVTVGVDGSPLEATIVSITNKQLSAAAIETAVSSTYAPAMQNGHPVAAKYIATFSFDGEDPALSSIPVWKRPLPAATASPSESPAPSPASPATDSPAPSAASPAPSAASPAPNEAAPAPSAASPAPSAAAPAPSAALPVASPAPSPRPS